MKEYVVFDLETTGLSPQQNEIIEIGAWRVVDGIAVDKRSQLVQPLRPLPYKITQLTGITQDMLAGQPFIEDVLPAFMQWVGGRPVVCHNIKFDAGFVKEKCKVMGIPFNNTGVCTLQAVRGLHKDMGSHRLSNCVSKFQLDNGVGGFHRAEYDAYMTYLLYERLKQLHGNHNLLQPERL